MQLLQITLEHVRLHRQLNLPLASGITVLEGANESGKSTLAEAIHRALFLPARTAGAALNQLRTRPFQADPTVSLQSVQMATPTSCAKPSREAAAASASATPPATFWKGNGLKSAWPSWSAHQPFVAAISDVCASVGLTFGCGKGRQVLIP